jgi:hypothetical protein
LFLLGSRTSSGDLRAAAVELDAAIRENAAAVQARADTLAQLPRLAWAVATDEDTMRDLTTEELAFRTHPGEHIEITQVKRSGGEARRLLRLPAGSELALPIVPGTRLVVQGNDVHLVIVVGIEPRERADEIAGILAVAKQLDLSGIQRRLAARGINAELRTGQGAATLAGAAPRGSAIDETIALAAPAGQGAELVAGNLGRARWRWIVAPLVLVIALVGAAYLWRRAPSAPVAAFARSAAANGPARHAPSPLAPATAPRKASPTPIREPTPTPLKAVPVDENASAIPSAITPAEGNPLDAADASESERRQRYLSGRVDISLARSGSVSVSRRATPGSVWPIDPHAHAPHAHPPPAPPPHAPPSNADDPRGEEYRALFEEFVKLRRTTGESVEGLDVSRFVETLREKRAQIMKQLPVKDVRFKLAFQNGKAGIRYQTVT